MEEINQNTQITQPSNSSDSVAPSIISSTPPISENSPTVNNLSQGNTNQGNLQTKLIAGWFFFLGIILILFGLGLAINGVLTAFSASSSSNTTGWLMLTSAISLFIGSILAAFTYFRVSRLIRQLSQQGYRLAFFLFLMPIVFGVTSLFIYQSPGNVYLTLIGLAINLLFLTLLFKNRALFINDQPSTALRFLIIGSIFLAAGLILNIYLLQIIKSELRTTTEESRAVIEKSQKSIESLEKKLGEINKTAITEWETYSKDLYGFSLEYPKGWFAKVIESGEVPKNRVVYVGFSEKPVAS